MKFETPKAQTNILLKGLEVESRKLYAIPARFKKITIGRS